MYAFGDNLDSLKDFRFFYNGVKVNGEKKLQKLSYQFGDNEEIYLTAEYYKDCVANLLFGYMDASLNPIKKENPLYPYIYNAALESTIHGCKRELKWINARIQNLSPKFAARIPVLEQQIKNFEADLIPVARNPDEKVIAAYKDYVQKKQQEIVEQKEREEKERKEQAIQVYRRKEGHKEYAKKLNELYPIREKEYYVELGFSESPAIDEGMKLSLKAADKYLGFLDEEQHINRENGEYGWGWYDKTDFKIINDKGEEEYAGRYDLGDGDIYNGRYGIISHIMSFAEGIRKYPNNIHDLNDAKNLFEFAHKLSDICYGDELSSVG